MVWWLYNMDIKFIDLNKRIKENIDNLYNLKGEDIFLIKQAINNIKNYAIKDFEDFNFVKLDAENMHKSAIEAEISTLPIGNDYRMIVLENLNAECVEFLNNYDFTDSVSVIVAINCDKLKNSINVDCNNLTKLEVSKYILNSIAKAKISIQEQAVDYIIDATNSNMSRINTELNKMIAYVGQDGIIDMQVATNLISNSSEYVIYMLTGAIDEKNWGKYQKILKEMLQQQSANEIYSYLGKYFRRMQYIAINKDDDLLAKTLAIKPYAIKISRQNISKNGVNFYINLYQKYTDLDYQIKTGKISAYNALYQIIF